MKKMLVMIFIFEVLMSAACTNNEDVDKKDAKKGSVAKEGVKKEDVDKEEILMHEKDAGLTRYEKLRIKANDIIDRWLQAQNSNNFELYKSLYSESFRGVKRVGKNSYEFDSLGWLSDRKKMFKDSVKVRVEGEKYRIKDGRVVVNVIQTWESGSYKDKGEKVIELTEENGALKIVYEEMKNSFVMKNLVSSTDGFLLVAPVFNDRFILLDYKWDQEYISGLKDLASNFECTDRSMPLCYVYSAIPKERIPKILSRHLNKEIYVYDSSLKHEKVMINNVVVIGGAAPYYGMFDMWKQYDAEESERKRDIIKLAGDAGWKIALEVSMLTMEGKKFASHKNPEQMTLFKTESGSPGIVSVDNGYDVSGAVTMIKMNGEVKYVYHVTNTLEEGECGGYEEGYIWEYNGGHLKQYMDAAYPESDILLDINNNGLLDRIDMYYDGSDFKFFLDGSINSAVNFPYNGIGC